MSNGWRPNGCPGTFARQLTLGDGVDLEHIAASYTNGVLTLTLPVAEAAKPRKIPVDSGGALSVSITTRNNRSDPSLRVRAFPPLTPTFP